MRDNVLQKLTIHRSRSIARARSTETATSKQERQELAMPDRATVLARSRMLAIVVTSVSASKALGRGGLMYVYRGELIRN